tara:strand:+ start:298 stop:480 length:183 start_codon:yes stop_codon:yes gene_type:complete
MALTDSKDYPPFKKDDEKKRKREARDNGTFVPKGNPYHVSKNSEVILIKERKSVITSSRA